MRYDTSQQITDWVLLMSDSSNLKSVGLKVTLPRIKILNLFETSSERHMTADDVYRQLLAEGEDLGLATVYRVLSQFESANILMRHHFEGGKAVFELNKGPHHDHIMCLQCGKVEEFTDPEIEERQEKIAAARGFNIHEHTLHIYADCARKNCPNKPK
jgi:ferric uptake regulator, Fur family